MQREQQTDVLVVGAGPVGMLTALLLSEAGVNVRIIDQESRTASRTYACALHPRTLAILDRLHLTRDVLQLGRRIESVGFYEEEVQRAQVKLSKVPSGFPFVVVLSQSAFEHLLEERLKQGGRVRVDWNHQLSELRAEHEGMLAVVEKLGISAKGFIVPEMDWSVEKTEQCRARYVVGADGPNSFVAKSLGFGTETPGESEFFAVYEFESTVDYGNQLRIILAKNTTSVLWPLPDNRYRWSFQLLQEHLAEFPAKERSSLIVGGAGFDQANRDFVEKLLRDRAPWFQGKLQELVWSTDVEFQHRLAKRFGKQRCWLTGDSAHQTSPGGMQSMNLGLAEGEQLALTLIKILKGNGTADLLESYNEISRNEWRRLLGLTGTLQPVTGADAWVKERSSRILSCLPASGPDLQHLLSQLGLAWG